MNFPTISTAGIRDRVVGSIPINTIFHLSGFRNINLTTRTAKTQKYINTINSSLLFEKGT